MTVECLPINPLKQLPMLMLPGSLIMTVDPPSYFISPTHILRPIAHLRQRREKIICCDIAKASAFLDARPACTIWKLAPTAIRRILEYIWGDTEKFRSSLNIVPMQRLLSACHYIPPASLTFTTFLERPIWISLYCAALFRRNGNPLSITA